MFPLVWLLSLIATVAYPQVQSSEQRACITGLHRAGTELATVVAKQSVRCIRATSRGSLPPGMTAEDCLGADRAGRRAAAEANLAQAQTSFCTTLPLPSFGATSAAAVQTAFGATLRGVHALYGGALDGAVLDWSTDRAGAFCQVAVASAMERLQLRRLAEFNRCAAAGLRDGSIGSGRTARGLHLRRSAGRDCQSDGTSTTQAGMALRRRAHRVGVPRRVRRHAARRARRMRAAAGRLRGVPGAQRGRPPDARAAIDSRTASPPSTAATGP